ncbi:MAG: GAP family protein [Methanobacterium sp. ERen5]|nr:MAG: GAP family protein [Methanobacterium sp. ERen5]
MSGTVSLLTQIIPLAFGAAVSPTALMGIILLLSISKKPKISGMGYYAGSILIVLIVLGVGFVLGNGVSSGSSHPNPLLAAIDLILGVILLVMGIIRIFRPQKSPKHRFSSEHPDSSSLLVFFKGLSFGLVMFFINFSTTLIVLEAGKLIATESAPITGKVTVSLILILITLLVCEVPLLIYFLLPGSSDKILSKINVWMQKNGHILMGVVILAIGLYLLWIGSIKFGLI